MAKVDGALMEYQSFFEKGSVFFLRPFLPLDKRLFFPTAIAASEFQKLAVERGLVLGPQH
jgi:hypothetical protein